MHRTRESDSMNYTRLLTRGLIRENPVFVLLLGCCPTLAVTTGLKDAIGMGAAATFVLVCSNVIISAARKVFPSEVRIPCYIVVIATFVTIVKMGMAAYFPDLKAALGIFLPLIVVNCIILARAEAFAAKNGVAASFLDGVGMGLGFGGAICLVALAREVLGSWKLLGIPITAGGEPYAVKIFILAPGGFLTLGLFLALFNHLGARRRLRLALAEKGIEEGGAEPVVDAAGGEA
ncbi:MAG: electron transport complex subunit RsxE [Planctomycetota bacterium]